MQQVFGDIWRFDCTMRVIPTNGILKHANADGVRLAVMGAGLAGQAARRYPDLPETLGIALQNEGNHVAVLGHGLIAFPTKDDWRDDSTLPLIERSAKELLALTNTMGYRLVALPRVGTGKGQLKWCDVRPILERTLGNDPRFVVVDNS